jgi:ubiquinone/menaquinone biosynthesis C-methylase UbiE
MDRERAAAHWEKNAETWTQLSRAGYDVYRDHVNTPAFLAMLPPVAGLHGLDIGCGEGANTRALAKLGARMTAIDVAPTFVLHARETEAAEGDGIEYSVADAQALPFADKSFDFATAFMSLMDVPDFRAALGEAHRIVRPGGFFQFSILHPCFDPPHRRVLRDDAGTPYAIEIARYFDNIDGEVERWKFSAAPEAVRGAVEPFSVPRFHYPLSDWLNAVVAAGFNIERIGEPSVDEATARRVPNVADTRIVPLFLHIRGRA